MRQRGPAVLGLILPLLALLVLLVLLLSASLPAGARPSALGSTFAVALPTSPRAARELGSAVSSLSRGEGPANGAPMSCGAAEGDTRYCARTQPTAALPAVTPIAWQDLSANAGTPPSARVGVAMAYDASDGYVVLYGGLDAGGTNYQSDTWTFVGGVWTNVTGSAGVAPALRVSATMAYDPPAHGVILFGGLYSASSGLSYWSDDYSDTWRFSSGTWTNLTTTAGTPPAGRFSMSMAFDPFDHVLIAFGGESASVNSLGVPSVTMYSDTWTFNGATWNDITATAGTPPSPRAGANMVLDPGDGYVLLYGGLYESLSSGSLTGYETADTWSFSSGSWTNRTATTTGDPGDLALSGIAWDGSAGKVVMFGGCTPPISQSCPVVNYTWTYRAGVWTNLSGALASAPSARASGGMANDTRDGYLVLYGGSCLSGCATSDTWSENGAGSNVLTLGIQVSPSSCGSVLLNGVAQASGSSATLPAGNDTLVAPSCAGREFGGWNVTGGLAVTSPSAPSTFLHVWAAGTLTAWFHAPLGVSASTSSGTVGLGTSATLSATPWGGLAPYTYLWSLNGTNTTVTSNPWVVSYPHAGTFTYRVWATDQLGAVSSSAPPFTVQVLTYTPTPLVLNLTLTSYYAPTGSTLTGTASTTGGTISSYTWRENGTTPLPCTGATCPLPFPHGGRYGVEVSVLDSLGRGATAQSNVTVWTQFATGPPPALSVVLTSNVTTVYVGEPVTFNATISGGIPPYHGFVLWMNGSGNSSPLANRQFSYSFPGAATFSVRLWAYDAAGEVASSNILTITVDPVPSSPQGGGGLGGGSLGGIPLLALLLVVIAVVAVGLVVVLYRRGRRRSEAGAGAAPEEAYYAQGGGMGSPYASYPPEAGQGGYGPEGGYQVPPGPPPQRGGPYRRA